MDIWGLCHECDRWFFCAGWFDKARPAPTCPVCATEPRAIVNRAAYAAISAPEAGETTDQRRRPGR